MSDVVSDMDLISPINIFLYLFDFQSGAARSLRN